MRDAQSIQASLNGSVQSLVSTAALWKAAAGRWQARAEAAEKKLADIDLLSRRHPMVSLVVVRGILDDEDADART